MKYKKIFLIVFLTAALLTFPSVSASTSVSELWHVRWGSSGVEERITGVVLDSSGNIYAAGNVFYAGSPESAFSYMRLIKCDSYGNPTWEQTWNSSIFDGCTDIVMDSMNNVYLGGFTKKSYTDKNFCLVKYNSMGVQQWNRSWGGTEKEECRGVGIDSLDNIYLTGGSNSFGTEEYDYDMYLVKCDSEGILQWNLTWGGSEIDGADTIVIDSSDNIYISGAIINYETHYSNIYLLKYDSSGILQWNRTWSGEDKKERVYDMAIDSSDNIYIAGTTQGPGTKGIDLCLLKYDNSGTLLWNVTIGGDSTDLCYGVLIDPSDNAYLIGHIQFFHTQILEFNGSGALVSNRTWDGDYLDFCCAVAIDSEGNIYLAGETRSFGATEGDMILLKIPLTPSEPSDPSDTSIPGYNLLIFVGTVLTASIILIKRRHKHLK